jgi:hypothetical protein
MIRKSIILIAASLLVPSGTIAESVHPGGCPEKRPCPEVENLGDRLCKDPNKLAGLCKGKKPKDVRKDVYVDPNQNQKDGKEPAQIKLEEFL